MYLLVIVDIFTKWVVAAPLSNQKVRTVLEAVYAHWVVRYRTHRSGFKRDPVALRNVSPRGYTEDTETSYYPQGNS